MLQQLMAFGPMILIFVVFYFMLVLPEKKRKKQYQEMLTSLKVNDEVLTRGGIMGKIVHLQEEFVILESGPERTKIKVSKQGISAMEAK